MYNEEHSITFSGEGFKNTTYTYPTLRNSPYCGKLRWEEYKTINGVQTKIVHGANTWTDWHLIPTSRQSVVAPQHNAQLISIPGRNGSLDISDYLTGGPTFGDRAGSWEFYVDNGHEYWMSIKYKIFDFLHGKRLKCVLEDDPAYYYIGRFNVNWKDGPNWSSVTINYTLEPYKYYWNPNKVEDWLWDPFNFEVDRTDYEGQLQRI